MEGQWMNALEVEMGRRGFRSYEEYQALIRRVDLGRRTSRILFDAWVQGNGTRQGLMEIIRLQDGRGG